VVRGLIDNTGVRDHLLATDGDFRDIVIKNQADRAEERIGFGRYPYSALANVGAKIVAPLIIGRHFHPGYDTSIDLWECLRKHTWSLKRCGICGPVQCPIEPAPSTPRRSQ